MSKEDSAATGSRLDARVLTHRVGSAIVQRAVFSGRRTAGCPSGQRERSVKPSAQPTLVRTQHLPPGEIPAQASSASLTRFGCMQPGVTGSGRLSLVVGYN